MLLQAVLAFDLDPEGSRMVGDKENDDEAARHAGVGRVVLLDPTATILERMRYHWRAPSLAAVTAPLPGRAIEVVLQDPGSQ